MNTPPVRAPLDPAPLDPARALDATRASVARDGSIYLPIAGAFVLLPQLATMLLGPQMPASTDAMMKLLTTAPWPLLLSLLVPAFIGLIADLTISRMVIDAADGRSTPPRAALLLALRAWPLLLLAFATLFIAVMGVALVATPLGMTAAILLAMPLGLVLMARMLPLIPLLSVEPRAPFDALQRSWALGIGNGWRLFGVALVLRMVTLIVSAFGGVVGNGLGTLFGGGLGRFVQLALPAAAVTAMSVVTSVLVAHVYLQLRGRVRI